MFFLDFFILDDILIQILKIWGIQLAIRCGSLDSHRLLSAFGLTGSYYEVGKRYFRHIFIISHSGEEQVAADAVCETEHCGSLSRFHAGSGMEFCPAADDAVRLYFRVQCGLQNPLGRRYRRL